jgi:hypothetical protein
MGSEYQGEKTIADLALESFGLSVPLIRFHDIPSRCPSVLNDDEDGEKTKSEKDAVIDILKEALESNNYPSFQKNLNYSRTDKHPHVTTWYPSHRTLCRIPVLTLILGPKSG